MVQNFLVQTSIVFDIGWCWSSCRFWTLKPILSNLGCFCIIFNKTIAVNIIDPIAGDQSNHSHLWLNVSFAVSHWWTIRSITDFAIDLLTSKDRFFVNGSGTSEKKYPIVIHLITMKARFYSASTTSNNPPFFLVLIRWSCNDLSIQSAPENMLHRIFITIYFYIWTWYKPINGIFSRCGISVTK